MKSISMVSPPFSDDRRNQLIDLSLIRNLREIGSRVPLTAVRALRFIGGWPVLASDVYHGIEAGFALGALEISNIYLHFAPPHMA